MSRIKAQQQVCGVKEITHQVRVGLINGSLQLVYDFPRAGTRRPSSDFSNKTQATFHNHLSFIIIFLNMIFSIQLELVYRREEEALLTADAYRVAFEQQLAKNSTLICDLLEKSNRRKKFGCPNPVKKRTQSENGVKAREDLIHEMQIHKDEIVEELLSMVSTVLELLGLLCIYYARSNLLVSVVYDPLFTATVIRSD